MNYNAPCILAIESSCDDTSAAIAQGGYICSNVIKSQCSHEQYGGVVPEIAAREHTKNMVSVVSQALLDGQRCKEDIDWIAYCDTPGLPGSLMVGKAFAQGLSLGLNRPYLRVNHLKAHALSVRIENLSAKPLFPYLCLMVSGGNTLIFLVKNSYCMEVLGQTKDDAAGEALDKIAIMLGLKYPGGKQIDKNARMGDNSKFQFAKPNLSDYDYSFSGFKTSVKYFLEKKKKENPNFIAQHLYDLCASIEKSVVDILLKPFLAVAKKMKIKNLALVGGVSSNTLLRNTFVSHAKTLDAKSYIPDFQYCTDNAAMIAFYAYNMLRPSEI